MKPFKELLIWQKGMQQAKMASNFVITFPQAYKFNLGDQILRASISIPSNIAEGSSRKSAKDQFRFLEIALGSCFELETQILLARQINIGEEQASLQIIGLLKEIQKMITQYKFTMSRNIS